MPTTDPHRSWLKELRALSVRLSGGLSDDQPGTVPRLKEEISSLHDCIIDTAPSGKDGVLVQIDLLQDLAWSDAVRRLAISLNRNILRLWPD
ncbi:MAG: hypothetical protein ACR2RF_09645 [Geminicoccaceae bacterium]